MTAVGCQDLDGIEAFGCCNYCRVNEAKVEIFVFGEQLRGARNVFRLERLYQKFAIGHSPNERCFCLRRYACVEEITDFGQDAHWNDHRLTVRTPPGDYTLVPCVVGIDKCVEWSGVGDYRHA